MQTQKMSLANIKGKLSRTEMKNIMAGDGGNAACDSSCSGPCTLTSGAGGNCHKPTSGKNADKCFCVSAG